MKQIHIRNEAVRDHFYFSSRRRSGCEQETLYGLLRVTPFASSTDPRLAWKLRLLELGTANGSRDQLPGIERAFNLLANPDLRSCYDSLLVDRDVPAIFPCGSFGYIVAAGQLSADRETFFAARICFVFARVPHTPFPRSLRKVEFFNDCAVYRDSRRKVEVLLDELLVPLSADTTWNQWKHLVGAKFGVDGTFVKGGKYRLRNGEWRLIAWETALPSRLQITLPADLRSALDAARKTYTRFGQYFDAIQSLRARIEREPLEREDLRRICSAASVLSMK